MTNIGTNTSDLVIIYNWNHIQLVKFGTNCNCLAVEVTQVKRSVVPLAMFRLCSLRVVECYFFGSVRRCNERVTGISKAPKQRQGS